MSSEYTQAERHFNLLEKLIAKAERDNNKELLHSAERQLEHLVQQFGFFVDRNKELIKTLEDRVRQPAPTKTETIYHGEPLRIGQIITTPNHTYTLTSIRSKETGDELQLDYNEGQVSLTVNELEAMDTTDELDARITVPTSPQIPSTKAEFLDQAFPDEAPAFPSWQKLYHFDPSESISFPTPDGVRSLSMNARYFVYPEEFGVSIADAYSNLQKTLVAMVSQTGKEPNENESIPDFVDRLLAHS